MRLTAIARSATCLLLAFQGFLAAGLAQAQTLERIKQSGVITIAHRDASIPLSFTEPDKPEPQGLAVALCQRIALAVKKELRLRSLELRYVSVSSSTRIPTIQEGKADIECGSTTDNLKRREQVSFSHHHFFAAVQFLARSQDKLLGWQDLNGKTLAFTQGTSTQAALAAHLATKNLQFTTVQGKDHAESFALLLAGKADAFVLEDVLLASLKAGSADPKALSLAGRPLSIEPYALMVHKGDEAFLRVVNRELTRLYKSGDYAKLYKQWFQSEIGPNKINLNLPMSALLREQARKPSSVIPG